MQKNETKEFPRLLADIGGTNVRFGLETARSHIEGLTIYPNNSLNGIEEAIQTYLLKPESIALGSRKVKHAAIAIANPISSDLIQMTNAKWAFSIANVQRQFDLNTFLVINDFSALARALPSLAHDSRKQWGGEEGGHHRAVGLLGPGTGLGVSGLLSLKNEWIVISGEGGHVTFPPSDEREMELVRLAKAVYPHVSAERFLSGMGLELIYSLLAKNKNSMPPSMAAFEITGRALNTGCALCDEVVETFCLMLGTVAGNLALTLGATGGIYIGGGIVPRLGERFFKSGFRRRFEEKGRFSDYLSSIPVFVITDTFATLQGASITLAKHLED